MPDVQAIIEERRRHQRRFSPRILRELREATGLTQIELGAKCWDNRSNAQQLISRLERGLVEPRPDTLAAIAKALDIEPDLLCEETDLTNGPKPPPRKKRSKT